MQYGCKGQISFSVSLLVYLAGAADWRLILCQDQMLEISLLVHDNKGRHLSTVITCSCDPSCDPVLLFPQS